MDIKSKIEEPVAGELRRFNREFSDALKSETRRLQAAIEHIKQSSGKHIRPLLLLLTAKACGSITDKSINSAVLLELLHTATLIHDDVIDETKQRRGVPSLNAIFDNRISVLVGDYVLSTALIRSIATQDLRIISIVSMLGRDLADGEIKQLETAEEVLLEEACYFQVIKKKTAMLLSACMEIGAISAGASPEITDLFRRIGENLGYAFQIKDDIFDYYPEANIGKPTGNDIREGKVTLPLLHALLKGGKEAEELKTILAGKDYSPENIARLIGFAKASGGIEYATRRMLHFHDTALSLLREVPDSEAKEGLVMLAGYIVNRTK